MADHPAPRPWTRRLLVAAGLSLAACLGLRAWTSRPPPPVHAAALGAAPAGVAEVVPDVALAAGLADAAHGATLPTDAAHASPAFCAACHQGGPVLHDKPLRDTVEEWRRTPAAAAGRSCVGCHPAGAAADEAAVRAAFTPTVKVAISESGWGVGQVKLTATEAVGHRLPSTAGHALVVSLTQLDREGLGIEGTTERGTVGREVVGGVETVDSRLLPGEVWRLAYAQPLHDECVAMLARVEVRAPGRPGWTAWEERVVLLPE